jgi:hypothetical protein
MTLQEFKSTLNERQPPGELPRILKALWYDGHGDWHQAHEIAQEVHGTAGAWVHAYLHRKEGDLSNAAYWYSRAGKQAASASVEEEWAELVQAFLE